MIQRDPLKVLADEYRDAAGTAFAEGEDEQARTLRDAATRIDALRESLPEPPKPTRLVRG